MRTQLHKKKEQGIAERLSKLDWPALHESLWDRGYALTPPLLTPQECRELVALYPNDSNFRSHIIMARYRFGRGDYKYFNYPLPAIVQELRESSYSHLAPLANEWHESMGMADTFPLEHSVFLAKCEKHGQVRATPLLLHYETDDFNCLHQDVYGDVAFPLQLTCFLSRPGIDYHGGEFVLVEQQPRAQSKAEVMAAAQGQILIFTTRYRPVKGSRAFYRTNLKHGVSRVKEGTRFTLGVIYHDSR
ncbi:MAG: proline hydroxylase [Acidobacteria bacterium]|jgi:hypothetical protein|nr:MAG: proline hydroxylase [Acidobacteriota bacterium]